jgi:hypothetical protein
VLFPCGNIGKILGVPKATVSVVRGHTAREKTVAVSGYSVETTRGSEHDRCNDISEEDLTLQRARKAFFDSIGG